MRWRAALLRLMLTMMLLTVLSPLSAQAATTQFSDIKNHWALDTITWAVDNHIVTGFPDGTFRPNEEVTEPQFLVMLLKAYPDHNLPKLSSNAKWYEPYYQFSKSYNWPLLHEIDGKQFNRGSVAHLLAATQGQSLSLQNAVQYVLDHGIASGKTSATVAGFGIQDKLKRSEALTLIKNMVQSGLELHKAEGDIPKEETAANATVTVRGITIGDSADKVIARLGTPARYDLSEYGFEWYIYNQDYTNYAQIGVANGKVVGLYSNVDNWSIKNGIRLGSPAADVSKEYGDALTSIIKGNSRFSINKAAQEESPLYLSGGSYMTFFIDKHNQDTVTAVQVIERETELSLQDFHGKPSERLRESFEKQVFDLANSIRVRFGYKTLVWNEQIANTARKHSKDMAEQDYFSHDNLAGLSPFDRMDNDHIVYRAAAENLAAGQTSAIFAHEGLMNSQGHRVNILSDIERLGVGVYFGGSYETYYTQNFYTPL